MPSDSRFRRLPEERGELSFTFDGQTISAREGDSVAAALMAAGVRALRNTPVSRVPRGPYCLMGVCFECLVEIDGVQNVQSCMVEASDGMRVRSMRGARCVGNGQGSDDE